MTTRRTAWVQAYVVVRVDQLSGARGVDEESTGPAIAIGGYSITVKEVVLSLDEATHEVDRLNALNADEECSYYWQGTRLFLDGGSFGSRGAKP